MKNNGWLELVRVWGIPGALLVYLIYWMTQEFSRQMAIITAAIHNNTDALHRLSMLIQQTMR